MASVLQYFTGMIVVHLFYAFSITMITYGLAQAGVSFDYVSQYELTGNANSLQGISNDLESSFNSQSNLPLIEVGALVFYSGNIIVDLLLNFATATPQMFMLIITGFGTLFSLNTQLLIIVQTFLTAIMIGLYVIAMITFLAGLRSGRVA